MRAVSILQPVTRLRTFWRDLSGQVVILVSIFAPIAVVMAAFAVDVGATAEQKRKLQGLADLAAIAAASNIEKAELAVYKLLSDNGYRKSDAHRLRGRDGNPQRESLHQFKGDVSVELGRYFANPDLAFDARFEVGGEPVNAVRVSLTEAPARYFDFIGTNRERVSASGTASVSSEVAMSIGSRLARLEDGLLNAMLSGLTGSEFKLTVMDYNSLVNADVDLLKFSETLASDLDLEAVTYDDVLDSDVALTSVFSAMADVSEGSLSAKSVLQDLASNRAMADLSVQLSTLFDLGPVGHAELGSIEGDLDLVLEAVQMVTASAIAANGANQVDLDLGANVPGLVDTRIALLVGERPQSMTWFSLTDDGQSMVSTAQLRLFIEASVTAGGALDGDLVRLPLYIEMASAEARIAEVICANDRPDVHRVDIEVDPSILTLRIADLPGGLEQMGRVQRFEPARLVNARLIEVSAVSRTSLSSPNSRTLRFHSRDFGGDPKTVQTREALRGAISSTIGTLDYDVDIAGLSLTTPRAVTGLVGSTLQSAAGPVDSIVDSLTEMLGIGVGEADVWVHHARCNRSVLVQ